LCFLLGNDFLPHFPSISVHSGGLDELIDSYIKCLLILNCPLIQNKVIYNDFLQMIFENMGQKEQSYFYNNLYNEKEKHARYLCRETDPYKKTLWEMDNLKNGICDVISPEARSTNCLQLGENSEELWKHRYYEHYFKASGDQKNIINKLCHNYLEGIKWMTEYYFTTCPDWQWNYTCYYAPFVSDMADYMKSNDINNIHFTKRPPVSMIAQLLSIIPPKHVSLLPPKYRHLLTDYDSPIIDMFPNKIKIDTMYKTKLWMCVPRLPYLDINRVLESIR